MKRGFILEGLCRIARRRRHPAVAFCSAVALFACAGCAFENGAGTNLPRRATSPVFSADGRRLAFQQDVGGRYAVGILELATGGITWVEKGAGQACHPAWTPDGGLLYVHSPETRTAYQWLQNQTPVGYNLWRWKDGAKTRLTDGRVLDATPGVTPDGKTVYFASDRLLAGESSAEVRSVRRMFSMPLQTNAAITCVRTVPGLRPDSAIMQPVVSPDGRHLAWAEQISTLDSWRLCAARIATPDECCRLTPEDMTAYAPRWTPDGRHLLFTGYRPGDAGWSVYSVEVASGALKRICLGREATLSPNGRDLVYETDAGDLVRREIQAGDLAAATARTSAGETPVTERVLWSGVDPARDTRFPLDAAFSSARTDTFFVRVEIDVPEGTAAFEHFFVGGYAESETGFQLYTVGGDVWFASRNPDNSFAGVCANGALRKGFKGVITGVRRGSRLYLQIGDSRPIEQAYAQLMDLATPRTFHVGRPQREGKASRPFGGRINRLEYGVGWPKGMRREATREEVFE